MHIKELHSWSFWLGNTCQCWQPSSPFSTMLSFFMTFLFTFTATRWFVIEAGDGLPCMPYSWPAHHSQPLEEGMRGRRRRNHINQPNENIPSDMRKRCGHGKVVWGEVEREAKDWRIKRGSVRRWQLEVMKRGVIRGCGMMFSDYFLIFSSLTFCIFFGNRTWIVCSRSTWNPCRMKPS